MIGKFSNQINIENHTDNSSGETKVGMPVHIIEDTQYLVKPEDAGCMLLIKKSVTLDFKNIKNTSVFFMYGISTGYVEVPYTVSLTTTDNKQVVGNNKIYYNGFMMLLPIMVHEGKIYTYSSNIRN